MCSVFILILVGCFFLLFCVGEYLVLVDVNIYVDVRKIEGMLIDGVMWCVSVLKDWNGILLFYVCGYLLKLLLFKLVFGDSEKMLFEVGYVLVVL